MGGIKAKYLKRTSGEQIYPIAHADAVFTRDGERLGDLLLGMQNRVLIIEGDVSDPSSAWASIQKTKPKNGQIIVIKEYDEKTKTNNIIGYVYDSSVKNWVVFSGNAKAENVLFTNDIICAGEYTNVGNIEKTLNGTTVIKAKGKSVSDVFSSIFTKELQPTKTNPSAYVRLKNAGEYEVGTEIDTAYEVTFNTGSYTYGPSTNVVATSWEISNGIETSYDMVGTFGKITVGDGTNYSVSATISYTDGEIAHSNLGNESDPVVQILAGSTSKTSSKITGYRSYFYGILNNENAIDGNTVRSLTNGKKPTMSLITINVNGNENAKRIVFAFPTDKHFTIKHVDKVDGLLTDITSTYKFIGTTMVNDLQDENPVSYDLWVYQPAIIDSSEIHEVSIG